MRIEVGVVYGDLFEFVDFGYVVDVVWVNLVGLVMLVWVLVLLKDVRLDVGGLINDLILEW